MVFLLREPGNRVHMRIGSVIEPELDGRYTAVAKTGWWGNNTLIVYVRNDALGRQADAQRLDRWLARVPGLAFNRRYLLQDLGS